MLRESNRPSSRISGRQISGFVPALPRKLNGIEPTLYKASQVTARTSSCFHTSSRCKFWEHFFGGIFGEYISFWMCLHPSTRICQQGPASSLEKPSLDRMYANTCTQSWRNLADSTAQNITKPYVDSLHLSNMFLFFPDMSSRFLLTSFSLGSYGDKDAMRRTFFQGASHQTKCKWNDLTKCESTHGLPENTGCIVSRCWHHMYDAA